MKDTVFLLQPIGVVRSPLKSRKDCPRQGWEGGPEACLEIDPAFRNGLDGLAAGHEVFILTWLHLAERDILRVHPRENRGEPLRGVFSTRAPSRPNPIGLHRVEIVEILGEGQLRVRPLEALDGTPILDIKPVMKGSEER